MITEDHYIDYLTRTDLVESHARDVTAKLRKSHFLFLGYGLRDWNLRVILHRIAGRTEAHATSRGPSSAPRQTSIRSSGAAVMSTSSTSISPVMSPHCADACA